MSGNTYSRLGTAAFAGLVLALFATGCTLGPAAYELPPEPADYRLTLNYENVHTEWQFSSRVVTTDATPEGYVCIEASVADATAAGVTKPCRPEPLIFLRYDVGVGLDNRVRAGRSGRIQVFAYRQAPSGPRITGLKLWVSTDDGAHWRQVKTKARARGVYEAKVSYPRLSRTTGSVSLKAHAWDAAGNSVSQTTDRAYGLREGRFKTK